MPKIKITSEQMMRAYLDRLLKDKGEWSEDRAKQKSQREQLERRLEERIEKEMMMALTDDQLDELERRLDDGMTDQELDEFLEQSGADFELAAARAMVDFRAEYWGETRAQAVERIQEAAGGTVVARAEGKEE